MLTMEEMATIITDIMLNRPLSLTSEEATAFRDEVTADVTRMKVQCIAPDILCDFD